MRINNSRSSEIFDIFSDTMQKFNKKRLKHITKKADRVTGAVEAGELIAKWLGNSADVSGQVTKVLDTSTMLKSFRLPDAEGGALMRGFLIDNPPQYLNITKDADGVLFIGRDELVDFIQKGGDLDPSDLSRIITEADAFKFWRRGKGAAKRKGFEKALKDAVITVTEADGSTKVVPALTAEKKSEILQRLALKGMANNGALEQRLIADAISDLEPDQIAAITKRLDGATESVTDTTRVTDDVTDTTRVTDDVTDTTRVTDDVTDTTRVTDDVTDTTRVTDDVTEGRTGGRPTQQSSPEVQAQVNGIRDELKADLEALKRAGMEGDAARAAQVDALEDAFRKLKDLPPDPNVMRQIDSLRETIQNLEKGAGAVGDAAEAGSKMKLFLGLAAAGGAGLAFAYWKDIKSFFDNTATMRKHDPEKVKQLFSTAQSTMSGCSSDTKTVLASMSAVKFTNNDVERAHQRMIRELGTYDSTVASLKKASLTPNLSQEEIRANFAMMNRTMAAMAGLVSVYMEDTGEIRSFAGDKKLFDKMQKDIRKVLPCYQKSLDTVSDEIKRLNINTADDGTSGGSTSAGAGSTGRTSGSTNRPGGIPSNAADFMYDPTVMATDVVKVPLSENIRVGNKMINFVNIPMPRGFRSRGQLAIKGAPWLAAALNDSRGKTILREEYMDIKLDPKMSQVKPADLFQFATNRAAFRILNAGIGEGALDDIDIDETFQDVVLPRSDDKDDSALKEFFTLGLAEDIEDRAGERAAQQARQQAQELNFADDGVTANSRKNQLKKISELIMSNENHRGSTNKNKLEDSIRKKSDDFAKSYYKDAKKGLSTEDSFMKSYYAGFSDMYDEGQNDKPKLDYKDSYSLHDETGDDLIHEAHPEAIVVSDAIGNGGLVENGSEQKRQSHGVAQSTPTGNYRANYAWLQEGLLKK